MDFIMTTKTTNSNITKKATEPEFKKKWGVKTSSCGWAGIPNILIERQQALNITANLSRIDFLTNTTIYA